MEVIPMDTNRIEESEYRLRLCEQLERGNILLLPHAPFVPSEADSAFLRQQHQSEKAYHKNIAYKPRLNRTTGVKALNTEDAERMNAILGDYSRGAVAFLSALFPNYARAWQVDYASFRPVEEAGRMLPLRHRNDLMHVDAFPTRPTHGGRILRAFTNLNADRTRVWATADSFEDLAARYARDAGLDRVTSPQAAVARSIAKLARKIGMRVPDRSPYDQFMLQFHHYLKANAEFQRTGQRRTLAFAPGATWITFTDQVAHAVLSGQYALEQTCIVPFQAMTLPELAPVAVLERLSGRPLIAHPSVPAAAPEKLAV
ncbi:MAG TPA: Kdo hydroxylase family protein [Chthonomonadaceae bacterium]|nr:Kdo hydroxylase family protein [Chthonomonadaceae bacterium]